MQLGYHSTLGNQPVCKQGFKVVAIRDIGNNAEIQIAAAPLIFSFIVMALRKPLEVSEPLGSEMVIVAAPL